MQSGERDIVQALKHESGPHGHSECITQACATLVQKWHFGSFKKAKRADAWLKKTQLCSL